MHHRPFYLACLCIAISFCLCSIPQIAEGQGLRGKKKAIQRKLSQTEEEEWSVLEQLRGLNESASRSFEKYSHIQNKVHVINQQIKANRRGVRHLKRKIIEDSKELSQKFEALYLAKKVRHITLLPGMVNFKNFLRNKKLLESSASVDAQMMQQYVDNILLLEETSAALSAQKQDIASLLARRKRQHDSLQWELGQQQEYLDKIHNNQTLQRKYLQEVNDQIHNIGKITTDAEGNQAKQKQAADFSGFRSYKKSLPLPVKGKIISAYRKSSNPLFKKGIVIDTKGNKSAKAVLAGRVIFAGPYRGFAEMVILDHGQGSYSVYGNLHKVKLSKGATIQRGGALGKVILDSLSQKHLLYFETRYRKRTDDPKKWLKASVWK